MGTLDDLRAKLVKDEATLARAIDHPGTAEWYIDHLMARIQFDNRMIRVAMGEPATIDKIQALVDKGVLDRENCPEPGYWHWSILKADEIPASMAHLVHGHEIRWYGEE